MSVFLANEQSLDVDVDALSNLAQLVISEEGYPAGTEVNVILIDDEEMAHRNARFLGREGVTDVLAFPIEELIPGRPPTSDAGDPPLLLGDVFIAPSHVTAQAEMLGVSAEDEMALMVTHGILHLLGYDHGADGEAEVMESRETELLEKVGRKRR